MTKIEMKANLPSDAELKQMFDAIPALERYRVSDMAVRAGLKPITARARQLIPRSTEATRGKRSKKQQQTNPGLDDPLWRTVKAVIRKPTRGLAYGLTGPEFIRGSAGQKIYLIAEHKKNNRRVFYWGKDAGKTVNKIRNVMVQAAEETRPQQLEAMKKKLKQQLDKLWKSNG